MSVSTTELISQLMEHQRQALDFMLDHPFAGIWVEIAGGKSLATLTALQILQPTGHILVIAPVAIARSTWIKEIQKWDLPIRTKSLIVDENDKKLTKEQRLARFADVFTDPPTMYFINQDLITQAPQRTNLITPGALSTTAGLDPVAGEILQLVRADPTRTRDELIEAYRTVVTDRGEKKPAKTTVNAAIKTLLSAGHIDSTPHDCRACGGKGCPACQFGLVDQMPVETSGGKKTILWPFDTVIIDESQEFKSHASERFKALKKVRPAISRFIELTGTPAPNGLHDLWSQIYLLDQGEALGRTITEFRNRWFIERTIPGQTIPIDWVPVPGAEKEIHAAISHLVMSARNESVIMPPEPDVVDVEVHLDDADLQVYKEFRKELVVTVVGTAAQAQAEAEFDAWFETPDAADLLAQISHLHGDELQEAYDQLKSDAVAARLADPVARQELMQTVIAANKAVLTSKLMQFASGTLYTADPDDPSTDGRYEVIHDEKIKATEAIIRAADTPVLVAYHFQSDRDQLYQRLNAAGLRTEIFDGSRTMDERWNARQIPVMLIHPKSAGAGLNLQNGGAHLIWYTLPYSLMNYQQANGRLHRPGQTQQVRIYRLMSVGTQDMKMPSVLAGKAAIQSDLVRAVNINDRTRIALQQELGDDIDDLFSARPLAAA